LGGSKICKEPDQFPHATRAVNAVFPLAAPRLINPLFIRWAMGTIRPRQYGKAKEWR
jgi:hypothetical protein